MLFGKVYSKQSRIRALALAMMLIFTVALLPACNKSDSGSPAAAQQQSPSGSAATAAAPAGPRPTDAKSALDALVQGNERYVSGNFAARDLSQAKLSELSKGQKPFAIVLTCSDSRVSPELLFDQSQGDLFVIRVAGNVMDKAGLGSIEYAAEHLHSPLIFVLGHEKCGAVTAATTTDAVEGNVQFLVNEIKPAVQVAKGQGGDLVEKSVDENVRYVVNNMGARSQLIDHMLKENKIKLAGGVYSLSTGKMKMVSELTSTSEGHSEGQTDKPKSDDHGQKKTS
jgi:carbonic anhydrase